MSHLEININKYSKFRGGSYLDLPSVFKNTKSGINIRNNDDYCFLWSIVAALYYPQKIHVWKTSSYPHYSKVLNTDGISFPPSYKDIKQFENINDLSVNIYGLDAKYNVTGPLYITCARKSNHINLLYIQENGTGHYCLVKKSCTQRVSNYFQRENNGSDHVTPTPTNCKKKKTSVMYSYIKVPKTGAKIVPTGNSRRRKSTQHYVMRMWC